MSQTHDTRTHDTSPAAKESLSRPSLSSAEVQQYADRLSKRDGSGSGLRLSFCVVGLARMSLQTKWEETSDAEKPAAIAIIIGVTIAQVRQRSQPCAADRWQAIAHALSRSSWP